MNLLYSNSTAAATLNVGKNTALNLVLKDIYRFITWKKEKWSAKFAIKLLEFCKIWLSTHIFI